MENYDITHSKDAEKYKSKINTLQAEIENIKTLNAENLCNRREEQKGHDKASLAVSKEKIGPENDERKTRMLSKFKKENKANLKLINEKLRRDLDI